MSIIAPPGPARHVPVRAHGVRRWVRGSDADPGWVRPALIALLLATAVLYMWGLASSGWANSFYSAAVQAGTKSWKAFFFGSFDAANFITVDKTPAFLWPMELSARLFGLNAWSILLPQAVEGVATVALIYATVRRWFPPAMALLAGLSAALAPVAVLMFRFNDPDALLTLLMVAAAYATVRAIEDGRTRWLVLAGTAVGFGFLAKELEVFLVVPGLALAYLIAGPTGLPRRVRQLLLGGVAIVASAGWWLAAVSVWPASSRPYIGGSTSNSIFGVILGYNGFGRLTGNEPGSIAARHGRPSQWGLTGLTRLFGKDMGTQVSWLLPAGLILLAVGLVLTWRAPRTDVRRATLVLWGGWLLVMGTTLSLGRGIIHPYYAVALAPPIGVVVAVGAGLLWERRDTWIARAALAATLVVTVAWDHALLDRTPTWHPPLRTALLVAGAVAGWGLLNVRGRLAVPTIILAAVVGLAAPTAYGLATAATPRSGTSPSAGPTVRAVKRQAAPDRTAAPPPRPAPPARQPPRVLVNGTTVSAALARALETDASHYRWVAAVVGSEPAAGDELATGMPVMALGGFNGTDPAPTPAQFERWVREHRIHYFLGSGGFGGSNRELSAISAWIIANFPPKNVDGTTVYDLSSG